MRKLLHSAITTLLIGLSTIVQAQQRDIHELDSIANSIFKHTGVRALASTMKMNLKSSQILQADSLKAREAFYVYTPASGDDCFVIVSGDQRLPAVLGYSDNTTFNADSLPEGLQWYLRKCEHDSYLLSKQDPEVTQAIRTKNLATTKVTATQTRATNSVEPLLGGRIWNQGAPFNKQCPLISAWTKSVTGCVATAMAQIMAYHKYPEKGTGHIYYTTPTNQLLVNVDLDNEEPYDWTNMLDSYENSGSYNSTQANAVAQLMFHAGASANMDYTNNVSGTYDINAVGGLINHFKYDDETHIIYRSYYAPEEWHSILQTELSAGRPIYYSGANRWKRGGHAFVIDGFDEEGLYHVNWGWSGLCNGYYSLYDLTPEELGIGSGGYGDYSYFSAAIVNILPENGITDKTPTNLFTSGITSHYGVGIFNRSQKITLNITYLENGHHLDFNGEIQAILMNENNEFIREVGTPQELFLASGYYKKSDQTLTFSLPQDLVAGKYRLYIGGRQNGHKEWDIIKGPRKDNNTKYDYFELNVKNLIYTLGTSTENIEHTKGYTHTQWATLHQEEQTFTLRNNIEITGWDIISTHGNIVTRCLKETKIGSTTIINLSPYPTGIYQLRGFGKDGKVYVLKFLKQ